jgi:sigma-B regulation protein RsbU (phosphoserine phosphatase)
MDHRAWKEVCLLHRPAGSTEWLDLTTNRVADPEHACAGSEGESPAGDRTNGVVRIREVHRLSDNSELCAILCRPSPAGSDIDDDLVVLRFGLTIVEAAHQSILHRQHEKALAFSLNQRLLQLNSLIDTGIEIATLDAAVSPCRLALERAVALTNASAGVVTASRGVEVIERISFPGEMPVGDASAANRCIGAEFTFDQVRYLFTLMDKESRNGVTSFDGTDRLLLDALSRQVQASLENRFLLRQSLEKQKMEQDLAVAASIQQRILPSVLPVVEGYDTAGVNIPCKSVGGDYYDCLPLPDGRYALVVADVAGKGIPAALLVSSLHAYLSAYLESGMPLVTMAARLNTMIHRASTDDKFITAFVALLDPASGSVEYVNAGHNIVYCRKSDGTIAELGEGGIPLGMLDLDFPYASGRITLECGDRLLLYTDGIPEAHNLALELYETSTPLREFFTRVVPPRADDFIRELIADLKRFTAGAPQADDITVLCLIRQQRSNS